MVEVLEEAGYTAIEAGDGPAGLTILQSARRIDLLITDVGLPGGMNGRQVADAARISGPTSRSCSSPDTRKTRSSATVTWRSGMQVITKPFAMAALANKIREMIEG